MGPIPAIWRAAVDVAMNVLKARLAARAASIEQEVGTLEERLRAHLTEAAQWSRTYHLVGMARPLEVDSHTIERAMAAEPRALRSLGTVEDLMSEDAFLSRAEHCIILGEPGAGKTTTIKRLIRKMLLEAPSGEEDDGQYPVVLRSRDLRSPGGILTTLADAVGIRYAVEPAKPEEGRRESSVRVGGRRLEDVLTEFLNATGAVVFIDGLDEVPFAYREDARRAVGLLALRLDAAKLILSCRVGDPLSHIEGVSAFEIVGLTPQQVAQVASQWLGSAEKFQAALAALPYGDIADRPLMLVQLLMLYKRHGVLPEQPVAVYQRLVRLMLEEWDAERGVVRRSRYAGFVSDRKLAFLAALSYHLLYVAKTKVFRAADLENAYMEVRAAFDLPEREAQTVVREIQSHTGLVIATSDIAYEFSHLSLQEYLCAEYLVREPFAESLRSYVAEYPAPLAVAVALSSSPSKWFAGLVLKGDVFGAFSASALEGLLSRVLLERPTFTESPELGLAILRLSHYAHKQQAEQLLAAVAALLSSAPVVASVASALMFYKWIPHKSGPDVLWFERRVGYLSRYGFETPDCGVVPRSAGGAVVGACSQSVVWEDEAGLLHELRQSPKLLSEFFASREGPV